MGVVSNRRGSILVLVLGIIVISGILMSSLIQLVVVAKQQVIISKDLIRYNSVLDSLLDYGIHGIKHRWCFSSTMLEEACTWTHPASAERLIMSDNTSRSLGQVVLDNPTFPATKPYRLSNFTITVPISSITSAHPLFQAVLPAQSAVFNTITYDFVRVTNIFVPERGEETIVRIRVTLNSSLPLFKGLTDITATSTLVAFPRRLNSFSAIIPQDLHMDLAAAASGVGDWNIPMFGNMSSSGVGIVFESPVYVNRDVYIPAHSTAADPPYSPATFGQKVILGTGRVWEGGALMVPQTPGGQATRFYDQASGLGGFLKGIDIDGADDQGLNAWFGALTLPAPDLTLANECRDNTKNKNNLENTKNSPLYFTQDPLSTATNLSIHLALGSNNQFYEQDKQSTVLFRSFPTVPGNPTTGGWVTAPATTAAPTAIGYLFVAFGPTIAPANPANPPYFHWIQARVGFNSTLSATFADTNGAAPVAPPEIKITIVPTVRFGVTQPNEADLQFQLQPGQDWANIPSPIRVYFKAFDLGTHGTADRRSLDPAVATLNTEALREANIQLAVVPGVGLSQQAYMVPMSAFESSTVRDYGLTICANSIASAPPPIPGTYAKASACSGPGTIPAPPYPKFSDLPPDQATNYGNIEGQCSTFQSARSTSFGSAPWGTSFTDNTRFSWHFKPLTGVAAGAYPLPVAPTLVFDGTTNDSLVIRSIVGRCQITAAATRVFALLGCDELVIDNRALPLEINGTIIAAKSNIDPAAVQAGITWRSLTDAQTAYALRNGVAPPLVSHDFVTPCPNSLAVPEFSPIGDILNVSNSYTCSPLKLIENTDPFNWTTVDPDCGVPTGTPFVKCMRRPQKYMIKEISRVSSM